MVVEVITNTNISQKYNKSFRDHTKMTFLSFLHVFGVFAQGPNQNQDCLESFWEYAIPDVSAISNVSITSEDIPLTFITVEGKCDFV